MGRGGGDLSKVAGSARAKVVVAGTPRTVEVETDAQGFAIWIISFVSQVDRLI